MFLQGSLQHVFDALYNIGAIDPVLESDWEKMMQVFPKHHVRYEQLLASINSSQEFSVEELEQILKNYDEKVLSFLAIEVAKEFAIFESFKILH